MSSYWTKDEVRQYIADCLNDVWFTYHGKAAGVTSVVENSIPTFQAWFGQEIKYYSNVDDVMSDPFYDGKCLNEIVEIVDDLQIS